jgi:hypothetical protein
MLIFAKDKENRGFSVLQILRLLNRERLRHGTAKIVC